MSSIPKTILDQLGGHRFVKMTGARKFTGTDEGHGLLFMIPGDITRKQINVVHIVLDPASDTYNVEFGRLWGYKDMKTISSHEGVYFDQLAPLFSEVTGLETRMPRILGVNA